MKDAKYWIGLIVLIVIAGFIIYSIVDSNISAKNQAMEAFSKVWNKGEMQEAYEKYEREVQEILSDNAETEEKVLELLDASQKALERGDVEESERLLKEAKEFYGK